MTMSQVAVVGSLNLDLVVETDVVPRPGETVMGTRYAEFSGGKGLNQAIGCARGGVRTSLIGAVGNDGPGSMLRQTLGQAGVDTSALETSAGPTGRAIIMVTPDGENSITVISEANWTLSPSSVVAGLDALDPQIVLAQLEIPSECVKAAHDWATRHHRRWILNPSPVDSVTTEVLGFADPLIVNVHEARHILGESSSSDPRLLATRLASKCVSVVVTAGSGGAFYATGETVEHVAAQTVTAIDTTGAGDEFAGKFTAELALGTDALEALGSGQRGGGDGRVDTSPV